MTSFGIPSRRPRKLYTEFQLEFSEIQLEEMEKELDQKNVMMEIQQIVMNAAVKDDAAIVIKFLKTTRKFYKDEHMW